MFSSTDIAIKIEVIQKLSQGVISFDCTILHKVIPGLNGINQIIALRKGILEYMITPYCKPLDDQNE